MIILRNKKNEIVDMFDTATEFKKYILDWLYHTESQMENDGLLEEYGLLFIDKGVSQVSFNEQLNMYLNMTNDEIEIK